MVAPDIAVRVSSWLSGGMVSVSCARAACGMAVLRLENRKQLQETYLAVGKRVLLDQTGIGALAVLPIIGEFVENG